MTTFAWLVLCLLARWSLSIDVRNDIDVGVTWNTDDASKKVKKTYVWVSRHFGGPQRVMLSFYANASCDIYPLEYQNADNITFVCNSKKIKDGAPLTLTFETKIISQWRTSETLYCSVYRISTSTETPVVSLDLIAGTSEDLAICLHRYEAGVEETITCRTLGIAALIKYFRIRSEFYYYLRSAWKHLTESSNSNVADIPIPANIPKQNIILTPISRDSAVIQEEEDCVLSRRSARLCGVKVLGNAKLKLPFDPYNALLFLEVEKLNYDTQEKQSDLLLKINNRDVNGGVKRRLTIFVNGVRHGTLPQTIDIGRIVNSKTNKSTEYDPILLTIQNEESSNKSFTLIRFVRGDLRSAAIMTISSLPEDMEFVKMQEADSSGIIHETDFTKRRPYITISRGMIVETEILLKMKSSPVLSISVIDKDVDVMVNGIRMKAENYKMLMLENKTLIQLKHRYFIKTIRLSYDNHSDYTSLSHLLWPLYICSHLILSGVPMFSDSLASYLLTAFLTDMKLYDGGGNMLIRQLALFFKDLRTTRTFSILLWVQVVTLFSITIWGSLLLLPKSWFMLIRLQIERQNAVLAIFCNCICVVLVTLYIDAFDVEGGSVYVLGMVVPGLFFKIISLGVMAICFIIGISSSVRTLGGILQHGLHMSTPSFSQKLGEMAPGTSGYHCFIEDKKIYKIYFTKVKSEAHLNQWGKNDIEIQVDKVASLPLNEYYGDTNITFRLIKSDFKGFEGMVLTNFTKLKNLELMSLMRERLRVWCNISNPKTNPNNCDSSSLTLYIGSTLVDLLFAWFFMMTRKWWYPGFALATFHLILKLAIFTGGGIIRYTTITTKYFEREDRLDVARLKVCWSDKLFRGLLDKCIRTFSLFLYIVLLQVSIQPVDSLPIRIATFWLLSCAFHTGFPGLHLSKIFEAIWMIRKYIMGIYHYGIAVYRFFRFGLLCNVIVFIKSSMPRWCWENGAEGRWHSGSFPNPLHIKVELLDLYIQDRFRTSFSFEAAAKFWKTVYIHPSVNLLFSDVSPCYYVAGETNDLLWNHGLSSSPTDVEYTENDINGPHFEYYRGTEKKIPHEKYDWDFQARKNINTEYSNDDSNVKSVLLTDVLDDKLLDKKGNHICERSTRREDVATSKKFFGIIEWRSPIRWKENVYSQDHSHNECGDTARKLHLYVDVGSLEVVPSDSTLKTLTKVTYDGHRATLKIAAPFIIPKERYTVRGVLCGDVVDSTTIVCQTTCNESGVIIFDFIEEFEGEGMILVRDVESSKTHSFNQNDLKLTHNDKLSRATLRNPLFTEKQEYLITCKSTPPKQNLCFIYVGDSHPAFKEIVIPVTIPSKGTYDIFIDKAGSTEQLSCVSIQSTLDDKHCYGMKSTVINALHEIYIDYPDIGKAHFINNTFHFGRVDGGIDPKDLEENNSHSLKVKDCQYLLGDNMSFLVPITVISRIRSLDGQDIFRVAPHYILLAYELQKRINELQKALEFVKTKLTTQTKIKIISTITSQDTKLDAYEITKRSPTSKELDYDVYYHNDRSPEMVFEYVMSALFTEKTLLDFDRLLKRYGKTDKVFFTSLQILLTFCINQLKEAREILLRQDEITNDLSLRLEMQKFDTLIDQGMMVEDAIALLNNTERFNYFLLFPFILKSEDIYVRVNVDFEVRRIMTEIRHYCGPLLFEQYKFVKGSLTEQLLSNVDLRTTCQGFCHIIIPSTLQRTPLVMNEYGFVLTRWESNVHGSSPLWAPCFICFCNTRISLTLSDRVVRDGYMGRSLEFIISSLECAMTHEKIYVIEGVQVKDEQVQVVAQVIEGMNNDEIQMLKCTLADDGKLTIRCHRRLLGLWKAISKALPLGHPELADQKLFDDNFDIQRDTIVTPKWIHSL
ncbi:uncharacterized protein BXIN_2318 [Babesia sp. Xinjiang]|uniref:uncharacterized protein n=1 Tax=Babesia sp. Xinjiang TaxID=462227 RepID=UPI000A253C90|nr:uncharacterized protein BXIN_2318 [Babesia sp. Xinjiang]ORM40754.1 hypothetical protein BXIN_2318 [Babesia sp. Xinjiang]